MKILDRIDRIIASRPTAYEAELKAAADEIRRLEGEIDAILHQWQVPSYLRLHVGEMSAQEVRTVGSVLGAIRRALKNSEVHAP